MPDNRDTTVARRFHNATKYVVATKTGRDDDILMGDAPNLGPAIGEQDPAIEPLPYKIYTSLAPLPLPQEFGPFSMPALEALAARGGEPVGTIVPDRDTLARLCLQSNGVLKRGSQKYRSGRVIEFRASGCTGARYHLELYIVCGDLPGLDAGVYHYAAHDHTLRRLRSGDWRASLVEASGNEPAIAAAPAVIVVTSTFWRNAWRYQERAWRHVWWDTGTTLSNLLALAASAQLPARVVLGYADAQVNALLDVDGEREAAVCLVPLGRATAATGVPSDATPLGLPVEQLSAREIDFPLIREVHHASSLADGAEAAAWRAHPLRRTLPAPAGHTTELRPIAPADLPAMPIDEVIRRRRSTRHFDTDTPLPFDAFSTLLERSTRGVDMDCVDAASGPPADPYLIVNNVEGLEPGVYVFHPRRRAVELLRPGNWRAQAAEIACDQQYAGDAPANLYYLADLDAIFAAYGNRGYRLAQLQSALYAGKLHLATHTLGLGAVGSTSPDDDVTAFFSPHAAGKGFMFVLAFGKRRKPEAAS